MEPIRKPFKRSPYGAKVLPLVTGRLLRSAGGTVFAVNPLPAGGPLCDGLVAWSTQGCPERFQPQLLTISPGALCAVTREDVHIARGALQSLSRRQAHRLPHSIDVCQRRLSQVPFRHDLHRDSTPQDESPLYSIHLWQDQLGKDEGGIISPGSGGDRKDAHRTAWETMLLWLTGKEGLGHWRREMERVRDLWDHPPWWPIADRTLRLLRHRESVLANMHSMDIANLVQDVHRAFVQISRDTDALKLDVDGSPDASSPRSQIQWLIDQRKSLQRQWDARQRLARHECPATLASWILLGQGELPTDSLMRLMRAGNHKRVRYLLMLMSGFSPSQRRKLVSVKEHLEDVPARLWVSIAKSRLSPADVRRKLSKCSYLSLTGKRGSLLDRLGKTTRFRAWRTSNDKPSRDVMEAWLKWAQRWPSATWNGRLCYQWSRSLSRVCELTRLDSRIAARWCGWLESLDSAVTNHRLTTSPINRMDPLTQFAARRLVLYRRVLGESSRWPTQIRRHFERRQRWAREKKHLENLRRQRPLESRAEMRLNYLRTTNPPPLPRTTNLRSRLIEAAITAALQAVRQWVIDQQSKIVRQLRVPTKACGTVLRRGELVSLLAYVPAASRKMLIEALSKSQGDPTGYKRLGTHNRGWLSKAARRRLDTEAWLQPTPMQIDVACNDRPAGKKMRLTVRLTSEPEYVLWMGRPFDSCLHLGDGEYREALVANLMDANKQLLVILDKSGQMIGRKLLAINEKPELLGYRLYLGTDDGQQTPSFEEVDSAVRDYCTALAERVGLPLGTGQGKPPLQLHGSQWYDDGTHEWRQPKSS